MENIETLLAAVAQTQGFDDDPVNVVVSAAEGADSRRGIARSAGNAQTSVVVASAPPIAAVPAAGRVIAPGEKRKRGRPPKGQVIAARPPPQKRKKVEKEEEDVCFICFDGGSLVLCDRKGCPKAYHAACIKRDEAFFRSKARWNCGWHICSVCRKASHYFCYTCTYSLCKACTKNADYVCVRENKGFCSTCMKPIMLIENKDHANNESVQVDFDDKTSFEYLFKVYWLILKNKLSLTLDELTQAKSPGKGAPAAVMCKPESSSMSHAAVGGKVSVSSMKTENSGLNTPMAETSSLPNDGLRTMPSSIDNCVNKPNCNVGKGDTCCNSDAAKLNADKVSDETGIKRDQYKPSTVRVNNKPLVRKTRNTKEQGKTGETGIKGDQYKPSTVGDNEKTSVCKITDSKEPEKTGETGFKRDQCKPSTVGDNKKPSVCKTTDSQELDKTGETGGKRDQYKPSTVGDNEKPSVCKTTDSKEPDKTGTENSMEWASKDLLEFVAFVRNGDTSIMAPFDVQTLLLQYIKRNNLRDPRQKSQIICDQRLKKLFVKPRLGHIEMLKLLEFHFPAKEDSQNNSLIPAAYVSINVDADANINSLPTSTNSRKRKTRRRNEEKIPQNNLNEYAAIDVHNINLIYLRRNLMENLLDDRENFDNKVIGSIVRIRTSSNDQRQDVYRLVRVVGTIKVPEPYKIGERTTNVMLEVLNLYKKEVVSIDAISNQEFTEEECRRLRQSIRCGLVKQLTVGEVQKIALVLQRVRIKDRLEAEILRLNHLRDRASEKGRNKEHRDYVDKLQLLKSPEERQRRIAQVPEIHADPKMSPNYESEEDEEHPKSGDNNKKVARPRPGSSGFPQNRRNPVLPNKKGKKDQHIHSQNRREKTNANSAHSLDKPVNQVNVTNSEVAVKNDQSVQRTVLETPTPTVTASVENLPSNNIETEKLWHYRDPNGKIQGPFSMMNLRKWNTTGLFPLDMRIWTNHEQYDSVLLTEALNGRLHGASESLHKQSSVSELSPKQSSVSESSLKQSPVSESSLKQSPVSESSVRQSLVPESTLKQSSVSQENRTAGGTGESEEMNGTIGCGKQTEAAKSNNVSVVTNTEPVKATGTESSTWPQCWDLLNDNISSDDNVKERNVVPLPSHGRAVIALPVQGQKSDEFNHGSQDLERNSTGPTQEQVSTEDELQNECNNENQAAQPNEEILPSLNVELSSNIMESEPVVVPVSNSPDSKKQVVDIDLCELHSPTPTNATDHQCVPDILELMSPTSRSNNVKAPEAQPSEILNFSELDSGSRWISDSTIAVDGVQLPGIANEWCGYSPTPVKQSIPEWGSGFPSASSLKPSITNEYTATSISEGHQMSQNGHQFCQAPPVEPISDTTSWLDTLNGPIVFQTLGEDSISDLFAEVDARESQGAPMHSPNTALKYAQEFLDCADDCFSSIEDFDPTPNPQISTPNPQICDASGSPGEMQMTSQSSCNPVETLDGFDSFKKSSVNSSVSSEAETNAQVFSGDAGSEFHPPASYNPSQDMVGLGHASITPSSGSESIDPGWGTVQGNINLVTVQGNVNLVLGGPTQGMANLGWGTNPGAAWVNPSINHSPRNMSLPWDGQRKYGGERFTSPRASYQGNESGFGRGRPPRGRQPFNSGYPRPLPRGQRICKFFESGHCKKGAFCDYLHP